MSDTKRPAERGTSDGPDGETIAELNGNDSPAFLKGKKQLFRTPMAAWRLTWVG